MFLFSGKNEPRCLRLTNLFATVGKPFVLQRTVNQSQYMYQRSAILSKCFSYSTANNSHKDLRSDPRYSPAVFHMQLPIVALDTSDLQDNAQQRRGYSTDMCLNSGRRTAK